MFEDGATLDAMLCDVFGDFDGERLTFRAAVPHYLAYAETRKKASTIKTDAQRLGLLSSARWTGGYLGKIRPEQITRWAQKRVQGNTSGATVNRDLSLASALFEWAKRLEYCTDNPVRRVERFPEKGREREIYLTAQEANALLGDCATDLRPVVLCALHTGMRRGELLALAWCSVDFTRGVLRIEAENEKTGRGREVPMSDALRIELARMRDEQQVKSIDGSDRVFVRCSGAAWSTGMLRQLFRKALENCESISEHKRNRTTFHTLRHTAASLLVQSGVPLLDVGKFLGHRSANVTWRYAHLAPDASKRTAAALGAALSGRG